MKDLSGNVSCQELDLLKPDISAVTAFMAQLLKLFKYIKAA